MNAGAKIGKFLKRHWLTGYVTMLNGFVYDAYWAEKIERAFGLLDQLQPKELGLAISDADYREWGLNLCDASSVFLTSWSGLSFYAMCSFCCSFCCRSYS